MGNSRRWDPKRKLRKPILGTGSLDSAHLTRTISDTSGDAESDDDEPTEEEMIELAAQIKREETYQFISNT